MVNRMLQQPQIFSEVPYFSQWESQDLIEAIVYRQLAPREDPLWQRSGALEREEYHIWSRHACGMACLKMLLAFHRGVEYPLLQLLRECREYGGYVEQDGAIIGLYYAPFVDYIRQRFALLGSVQTSLDYRQICDAISRGALLLVSVNKEIRKPDSVPEKKGGHLVLVVGVDPEQQLIYFHNPSGHTEKSRSLACLPYVQFELFFAYRGIVVEAPNKKADRKTGFVTSC